METIQIMGDNSNHYRLQRADCQTAVRLKAAWSGMCNSLFWEEKTCAIWLTLFGKVALALLPKFNSGEPLIPLGTWTWCFINLKLLMTDCEKSDRHKTWIQNGRSLSENPPSKNSEGTRIQLIARRQRLQHSPRNRSIDQPHYFLGIYSWRDWKTRSLWVNNQKKPSMNRWEALAGSLFGTQAHPSELQNVVREEQPKSATGRARVHPK